MTRRWMLRGILRYGHRRGPRDLHIIEDREGEQKLKQIREWGVTGMLGYVHNKAHAAAVLDAGAPAVIVDPLKEYLSESERDASSSGYPCVSRRAARHAMELCNPPAKL